MDFKSDTPTFLHFVKGLSWNNAATGFTDMDMKLVVSQLSNYFWASENGGQCLTVYKNGFIS